jgi:hypothetical protein
MNPPPVRRLAAVCAVAFLCAACSGGRSAARLAAPTGNSPARPQTLLVLGGADNEGQAIPDRLQDAWPYLLYRDAFPRAAVLVNDALDTATAADVLETQASFVRQLSPDVVAMWIGIDDLRDRTPIPTFTHELRTLTATLQADGAGHILIADIPSDYGSNAAAYDVAIRTVAQTAGAVLVELQHLHVTFVTDHRSPSEADAATHRAIANAFEQALHRP